METSEIHDEMPCIPLTSPQMDSRGFSEGTRPTEEEGRALPEHRERSTAGPGQYIPTLTGTGVSKRSER